MVCGLSRNLTKRCVRPSDGTHPKVSCVFFIKYNEGQTDLQPIPFECADKKFFSEYLKQLHHPLEDEGVDFWWLDWQQGPHSEVKGVDPLWVLNHYHFLDSGRKNDRRFTFSRYAGPGSHRYPIGFSGVSPLILRPVVVDVSV
jgi:hypothetical protein